MTICYELKCNLHIHFNFSLHLLFCFVCLFVCLFDFFVLFCFVLFCFVLVLHVVLDSWKLIRNLFGTEKKKLTVLKLCFFVCFKFQLRLLVYFASCGLFLIFKYHEISNFQFLRFYVVLNSIEIFFFLLNLWMIEAYDLPKL